jgi:hypothetical protein
LDPNDRETLITTITIRKEVRKQPLLSCLKIKIETREVDNGNLVLCEVIRRIKVDEKRKQ